MKPFTLKQKHCMERGELLTETLSKKILQALCKVELKHRPKRHHYIVGPSGIGKSLTVRNTAKEQKVNITEITGVASMNAIAIELACAAYKNRDNDKKLFVWIDDCDSVFIDRTSLSVMKGVLDEDRNVFAWNKTVSAQVRAYENSDNAVDNYIAEALRYYQTPDGVGISIPTDNMHFIITSNHPLAPSNPPPKFARLIDEAAIRDRVSYAEYSFDRDLSWGWTASVTMKNNVFGLRKEQKRILLEWMDVHWDNLASVSMRSVMELAADMVNYPSNYPDHWDTKLKTQR
jgi:hypothetical protein